MLTIVGSNLHLIGCVVGQEREIKTLGLINATFGAK